MELASEAGSNVFERRPILQKQVQSSRSRPRRDSGREFDRIEQRRAVIDVQHEVGNEKRRSTEREFEVRRKIGAATSAIAASGAKFESQRRAGMNREPGSDAISDDKQDEKKSGNHRQEF